MRQAACISAIGCVWGCPSKPSAPPGKTAAPHAPQAEASRASGAKRSPATALALGPCELPQGAAPLGSYADADGAPFWLDVTWDTTSRSWQPAQPLDMPHHHASRFEWTGLDAFPQLGNHKASRLRFVTQPAAADIQKVPGRREWRATYTAKVTSVCRAP